MRARPKVDRIDVEVVEVAAAGPGVGQVEPDLGVARPVEDKFVCCNVHFLSVPYEDGHVLVQERGVFVRRVEGGAFRRDYELVEVTGVTGADDLADLLVGVVGDDVVADEVSP